MLPNFLELFLDQPNVRFLSGKVACQEMRCYLSIWFLVAHTAKCCPIFESFLSTS